MREKRTRLLCAALCLMLLVACGGSQPPEPDEAAVRQDVQAYISELLLPGAELQSLEILETGLEGAQLEILCQASYGTGTQTHSASFALEYRADSTVWLLKACHVTMTPTEAPPETLPAADTTEQAPQKELQAGEEEAPAAPVVLGCGVTLAPDAETADLRGYAVDDLAGLEQCTALKAVYVDQGQLSDISVLAQLENLEVLSLNNVPVSDIRCLSGLTHLRELDIMDTAVPADNVREFQTDHGTPVQITAYVSRTYQAVTEVCTWTEASAKAEEMGGHLATVQSQVEFDEICSAANRTGLAYLWLGGIMDGTDWTWVTGEAWTWDLWYPGEPSGTDSDGAAEDRLCMWKVDGEWTFNDLRDDLSAYPFVTSGLGYMVEFEHLSGYEMESAPEKDPYTAYSELVCNTPDLWNYALCDLNEDGFPELMLRHGNSEADVRFTVYTYEDGRAVDCGALRGDHCVLLYQNGEVWSTHCHMAVETAYRITLRNGIAEQKFLYEQEAPISEEGPLYTYTTCTADQLVPVCDCQFGVNLTLLQATLAP